MTHREKKNKFENLAQPRENNRSLEEEKIQSRRKAFFFSEIYVSR